MQRGASIPRRLPEVPCLPGWSAACAVSAAAASGTTDIVDLTLSLHLPRDEQTVPVARHLIRAAMVEVGVEEECIDAIEIALSEACTNVLKHSGPGDDYEVSLSLDPKASVIRVVDSGNGFDSGALSEQRAESDAEHGRGVEL